jgi:hypothetical protein
MSGQWDARRTEIGRLELILLIAALLWLTALSLKRTRTLVAD